MMKHVASLAIALAFSAPALAQQLELPQPSPNAKVQQRVGLTDISVDYSSPGVKGRNIWGELVPWDKPWRTGANAVTRITFSKDVTFGGKAVPAGTYGLVTIPAQAGWTVILTKNVTAPAFPDSKLDEKDEVARTTATTTEIPLRERLAFIFGNTTEDATSLDIEWEKVRVSIPIKVDTKTMVDANIKNALDNAWRPHANSARYLLENNGNIDEALKYIDTSIAIQSTWFNNWIKAQILAKKNKWADARKFGQTAWDLGQKDQNFFAKDAVQKSLAEWKTKK